MQVFLRTPDLSVLTIDALCEVEKLAWSSPGENIEADREKIKKRLECFPQGVTLAVVGGKPAGSQYSFKLNFDDDPSELGSWDELTHSGWINEVHRPSGKTGFLVGVGVVPEFRRLAFCSNIAIEERRISELLIIYTLDKLKASGAINVIACARVPLYYTKPELSISEYCALDRNDGELYDPVLRFHKRLGATIIRPIEYSMEDAESLDAGCWVRYNLS